MKRPMIPGLASGTIVTVHNLRNRYFLPEFGLGDAPLMVSVADLTNRPRVLRAIGEVGIRKYLNSSGSIMIDSGAFSFRSGAFGSITVKDIVEIYRVLGADIYTALDVPPGPSNDSRSRARDWRQTLRNLETLQRIFSTGTIMPVLHGRTIPEIERACRDIAIRLGRTPIVALGGMVPFFRGLLSEKRFFYRRNDGTMAAGEQFVADAIAISRQHFPRSHLHVLGVGSVTTGIAVLALGADSVDSLAWRRAAGFGTIFLSGLAERIISNSPRVLKSRPEVGQDDRNLLESCRCPVCRPCTGFSVRRRILARSYVARAVHNCWTLRAEETAFRAAIADRKVDKFVLARLGQRHRFRRVLQRHFPSNNDKWVQ